MGAKDAAHPHGRCAGEVVEVGADVSEFALGDRIVSTFFPSCSVARLM
ncbi:alcohol dehydrogenase catalytic domain-containing protein [Komagataeibacter europaeus]|nr:hypothetical protein [Komagataeibacter europaeus]